MFKVVFHVPVMFTNKCYKTHGSVSWRLQLTVIGLQDADLEGVKIWIHSTALQHSDVLIVTVGHQ